MLWQRSPLTCEMLTGGSGWLVSVVIGADEGAPGDYRKLPVSLGGVKVHNHPKSDQVGWCWWWCVIANIISLVIQFQFWGVFFLGGAMLLLAREEPRRRGGAVPSRIVGLVPFH